MVLIQVPSIFARAEINRRAWVETTYRRLPYLLEAAEISVDLEENNEVREFLKKIGEFFTADRRPPLVFVNDSNQFILSPGEDPRLMRAPDGINEPIFINEELLSSDNLQLTLPQLIKLLTHELGHKTKMQSVEDRDRWSQSIEDFFSGIYFVSGSSAESKVEVISLSKDSIQRAFSEQPFLIQPSLLVFVHQQDQVLDLTELIESQVTEKGMLLRNLTSDIHMVLSETTNIYKEFLKTQIVPVMDGLLMLFTKAMGMELEMGNEGMTDVMSEFQGRYQYLSTISVQRVTHFDHMIILDGYLDFFHSHGKNVEMELKGLPFSKHQSQPAQVLISIDNPQSPSIQVLAALEMDVEKQAIVKTIKRSNGQISSLDIEFPWVEEPYHVALILNFDSGSVRVSANNIRHLGTGKYGANFSVTGPLMQLGNQSYSLVINHQKIIPLNREIRLKNSDADTQPPSRAILDVNPDSVGLWGFRGSQKVLQKSFSHLQSPMLSPVALNDPRQFVIYPGGFWVEFEIEMDVQVAGAELYAKIEQYILDIRNQNPKENEPAEYDTFTSHERVGNQWMTQRYALGGTLIETGILKMSIGLPVNDLVTSSGSQPGYQKVRIHVAIPIPHLRNLREPWEAHRVPNFLPHSLTITTTDGRRYIHNFIDEVDPNLPLREHPLCADWLRTKSK